MCFVSTKPEPPQQQVSTLSKSSCRRLCPLCPLNHLQPFKILVSHDQSHTTCMRTDELTRKNGNLPRFWIQRYRQNLFFCWPCLNMRSLCGWSFDDLLLLQDHDYNLGTFPCSFFWKVHINTFSKSCVTRSPGQQIRDSSGKTKSPWHNARAFLQHCFGSNVC